MVWHIIILTVFIVIYNVWRYNRENDGDDYGSNIEPEPKNNEVNGSCMEETISTRQLALRTIENIGSVPKYDEAGRIQFEYQGVIFLMEAANDCMFVNLIWPWCHHFSKFDIDEFARVRQVINDINAYGVVSVFYGDTDSDDVAVHVKKNFLFIQQIPNIEGYLRLMLDGFFKTVRKLDLEIEKLKLKECNKY